MLNKYTEDFLGWAKLALEGAYDFTTIILNDFGNENYTRIRRELKPSEFANRIVLESSAWNSIEILDVWCENYTGIHSTLPTYYLDKLNSIYILEDYWDL